MLCALHIKTAFVAAASLARSSAINKNHSNTATPAPLKASGKQAKHCGCSATRRRVRGAPTEPTSARLPCWSFLTLRTAIHYTTLASFVSIERRDAVLSLLALSYGFLLLRSLFRWLRTSAELKSNGEKIQQEKRGCGIWIWKTSDFVVTKGREGSGLNSHPPSRFVASESNKSLVS